MEASVRTRSLRLSLLGLCLVAPVALAAGLSDYEPIDPPTPEGWVYATDHRQYARYHASLAGRGTLYRVELVGDIEPSTEDHFPSWRARQAVIVAVTERYILLTMKERRRLFLDWGGSELEWVQLIRSVRA